MKKYIGTKEVQAEPIKLGEFIKLSGRNPYKKELTEEELDSPGYRVKYADGYESWSPKKVFDSSYHVAETFSDRMSIEHTDLLEKFIACQSFVNGKDFREKVSGDYPAFLLVLQKELMAKYAKVLETRIAISKGGIAEMPKMTFGMAIEALKFGLGIRRTGWNGKGLAVFKQIPNQVSTDIIPGIQSLSQAAKNLMLTVKDSVRYENQCIILNENTGTIDSWVPSVSDIFADDWELATSY